MITHSWWCFDGAWLWPFVLKKKKFRTSVNLNVGTANAVFWEFETILRPFWVFSWMKRAHISHQKHRRGGNSTAVAPDAMQSNGPQSSLLNTCSHLASVLFYLQSNFAPCCARGRPLALCSYFLYCWFFFLTLLWISKQSGLVTVSSQCCDPLSILISPFSLRIACHGY